MLSKIEAVKSYLNTKFIEREEIINMMFVCIVARQHMLLIGSAGTAKSALISNFSKMFDGANYFQTLLTRFTTPEEVFGALSLKELEHGIYKRNTANKMPESHITFLDEIFKSNSAILNSLLTIINERLYYNDGVPTKTPIMSVFGGSNEYPEENEGLEALFDRFLIRFEVDYLAENKNFLSLLQNDGVYVQEPEKISISDIQQLQIAAENVDIPVEVLNVIVKLREELSNNGIRPSDRRFIQSLSLLRANALLDKRTEVSVKDLSILRNGLWETIDQKSKVIELVENYSSDKVQTLIDTALKTCHSFLKQVQSNPNEKIATEALGKSKEMIALLDKAMTDHPTRSNEIQQTIEKIKKLSGDITTSMLGNMSLT